jgi:Zn finger protein HypA/HybF involved in hydrogenase expression
MRIPFATALFALFFSACNHGYSDQSRQFAEPVQATRDYPTVIHEPTNFGVLDTPLVSDANERDIPAGTACETCHGVNPDPTWKATPGEEFHTNITLEHGTLTCNQCHDSDRTKLHLADGRQLEFTDVMQLCSQCHGPQARDYAHGAHGGMNGFWDSHAGPRLRNNCVDCHVPHAPAFPQVMPVLPPRDRYLGSPSEEE